MNAEKVVSILLEDDGHSEHMKGWDRLQKWNGAHDTFQHLADLERKRAALYREMGQSIALERVMATYGFTKADVTHWITGAQVGATSNYKRTIPTTVCPSSSFHCSLGGKPVKNHDQEGCPQCGERLKTVQRPVSPHDLRTKYARWYVGVLLNDERTIWFNDPIPPRDYEPPAREIPAS